MREVYGSLLGRPQDTNMLSILLLSGDNVVRVRDDNLESGRELRVGYWDLCCHLGQVQGR